MFLGCAQHALAVSLFLALQQSMFTDLWPDASLGLVCFSMDGWGACLTLLLPHECLQKQVPVLNRLARGNQLCVLIWKTLSDRRREGNNCVAAMLTQFPISLCNIIVMFAFILEELYLWPTCSQAKLLANSLSVMHQCIKKKLKFGKAEPCGLRLGTFHNFASRHESHDLGRHESGFKPERSPARMNNLPVYIPDMHCWLNQ